MNAAANDNTYRFNNSLTYHDQLADKISLLAGQINAANYRFLKLIAEFDALEAWAGYGFRSCAHWLDWKCGIALGAARERVRIARALDGLPKINAAFEVGELSYSKVREMTRVATEENEEYLLMIAQYGTAQQLAKLVGSFRTVCRYQDFEPDDKLRERLAEEFETEQSEQISQEDERQFTSYQDDEGMWVIHARLPAEEGGLLVKLITALGDQIAVNHKDRGQALSGSCSSEASSSEASSVDSCAIDSCSSGLSDKGVPAGTSERVINAVDDSFSATDFDTDADLKVEPLTFPQRRADALVAIAEQFLAAESSNLGSLKLAGSERCQLMLHVHTGASLDGSLDASLDASLDGKWLGHDAAKCLACDASLVVVEEDDVGNVLNIGRRSRIIPAGMARALSVRDQGHCQFPGCCESHYVEGHHIQHWAEGGETKLDNLVTLCRYHHRELHRGHFFLSVKPPLEAEGIIESKNKTKHFRERLIFSRGGTALDGHDFNEGEVLIEGNPVCAVHSRTEIPWAICRNVQVDSAVTCWQGERMDLGMAVEGLMCRSGLQP